MLVAFFLTVSLGLLFSACARDRIRGDGPFAMPAFPLVAMFAGMVLAPVGLYFFAAHPAWTLHYLTDPAKVPGLMAVPFVVLVAGSLIGSWYVGAILLRADRLRAVLYSAGAAALIALIISIIVRTRLGSYGSYDEFSAGRGQDLLDVKLGYVLVTVALSTLVAAGYVALELMRDARRVRAR